MPRPGLPRRLRAEPTVGPAAKSTYSCLELHRLNGLGLSFTFVRRMEKLGSSTTDDEQQAFVFEEIEIGITAIRASILLATPRHSGKTVHIEQSRTHGGYRRQ